MTIGDAGQFLKRWWWLLAFLPAVGLVAGFVMTRDQPYQSSARATVLIPWDPEDPGSSERPELMVLDDAPALVGSYAFAEMVREALPADLRDALSVENVRDSLSGSRYSRVLTVTAARASAGEAEVIAAAAVSALPQAINHYLVAEGSAPATVRIIDPAATASQDATARWVRVAAQAGAALVLAVVLALLLDATVGRVREE